MYLLDSKKQMTPILVELCADSGVKKVTELLACDIKLVTERKPRIIGEDALEKMKFQKNGIVAGGMEQIIFVATYGKSQLLSLLEIEGKIDCTKIRDKWECFMTEEVRNPFPGVEKAIVIAGSDKRGTMYGIFSLSEEIGVTPFVFMGDVTSIKRENPEIRKSFFKVSKEPSVKYRGFFINDEWPCYGTWVTKHYGDFNAKSYEPIFQFLLRMKGNYMWPAMWSASFPLDGPGSENEELADLYGVVMGYSHHEPCLRASEEWDKVKGPDSKYGNEWNFATNREGLLNYWEDALIRSGKYDNMITIGMRGERDTSMLGENATVSENIDLLKEIITEQKKLIQKHVSPYRMNVPMLLALYKEVEAYYYGDEEHEGLQDWEGLSDVTCMLCEDNHGYMRTLPTEEMRRKKHKYGMYYHLDYHGDPVSYEWVDSTPFTKIWEQMCEAYEFGIREVWIVNVGDLKFHELPLSYFMELAYDYEKWGSVNFESAKEYIGKWTLQNFPTTSPEIREKIAFILKDYIDCNHLRRPEFLHENTYHPCHFLESDRMLERVLRLEELIAEVEDGLETLEEYYAFYSCIAYPALASINHIKLNLYAGKNQHYASQGRKIANYYKELAEACLKRDQDLMEDWSHFLSGKWDGMQLASHVGFTKWNDFGCKNPVLMTVYPQRNPRMNVSRKDMEFIYDKTYGPMMTIEINDFMEMCENPVILEIANDGQETLNYKISNLEKGKKLPAWLVLSNTKGEVKDLKEVSVFVKKEKLKEDIEQCAFVISDGDTCVRVVVHAKKQKQKKATTKKAKGQMLFYSNHHAIIMRADHFVRKESKDGKGFACIQDYGNYGVGMKVFPVSDYYKGDKESPSLSYQFMIEEAGAYEICLFSAPSNPVKSGEALHVAYSLEKIGKGEKAKNACENQIVEILPKEYRAGNGKDSKWANGVLSQIRKTRFTVDLEEGIHELSIYPMEPGFVLEQIGIYEKAYADFYLEEAYLGPVESFHTNS